MENRKFTGRYDIYIIFAIAVLAVLFFLWNRSTATEGTEAEISVGGVLVEKVSLSADRQFSVQDYPNVIFEVKDKAIRFLHSDCPDQICVKSGFLHLSGQSAACLPNKISLKVIAMDTNGQNNESFDEPDMIAN